MRKNKKLGKLDAFLTFYFYISEELNQGGMFKVKKLISIFLIFAFLLSLCSCSQKEGSPNKESIKENSTNASVTNTTTDSTNITGAASHQESENAGLVMLTDDLCMHCNTQEGYYYIPEKMQKLKDGSFGSVIMYMDFATGKEVYLCSNAGCNHDKDACTAIISEDEFLPCFGKIFVHQGKIYLLNRGDDTEGTVSFGFYDEESTSVNNMASVLYCMNPDGTGREKIYTFGEGVTAEEIVLGDEDGLYFITKELKDQTNEGTTVTTAENRKIIRYDISSGKTYDVASMELAGGAYWRIIGCHEKNVVLEGVQYGNDISDAKDYSADEWSEIVGNSKTKYVVLNLDDGSNRELYTVKNGGGHSGVVLSGKLYVSEGTSNEIIKIDLSNGTQTVLTSLKQNNICETMGNKLVCRTWDMTADYSLYFVDIDTGKVSHSTLVNQKNGWSLELMGETEEYALVIYDYKAKKMSDGAYEIEQYQYALITKENLYAGENTFRPIEMIGKGR